MKLLLVCVFVSLQIVCGTEFTMDKGSSLHLHCPGNDESVASGRPTTLPGPPGKKGPPGPPGPPGRPGTKEPDSELRRRYEERIAELESKLSEQQLKTERIGAITNPARSCGEIKQNFTSDRNGLYYIEDVEGNIFATYCDMVTANGGWTLVASVHENNMKGRCTAGDRWSSEQGNSADHPHGDGFWENRAVHGAASSATSDDYKNPGYFTMNASDVMIWHVPNNTPLRSFEFASFLKYHTSSGFLQNYGGNLQSLFDKHNPMRSKQFRANVDNGPAIPVTWDRGNNEKLLEFNPANSRAETDAGYLQFRAINHERNAFALCPGVRIKPGRANVEHVCVGSTSFNIGHSNEEHYCGDFAAKDWVDRSWRASDEMIDSAILIFYR